MRLPLVMAVGLHLFCVRVLKRQHLPLLLSFQPQSALKGENCLWIGPSVTVHSSSGTSITCASLRFFSESQMES